MLQARHLSPASDSEFDDSEFDDSDSESLDEDEEVVAFGISVDKGADEEMVAFDFFKCPEKKTTRIVLFERH